MMNTAAISTPTQQTSQKWLNPFTKLLCAATLFLIFAGAMVKSTDSGLAVPDWPLSYGMLFPPMVGGVFYEHGHRMIATVIGFMTLILAFVLQFKDKRKWVKKLGWLALAAVILQGVLGGITVLFFLPDPISVAHGTLAQTFLLLTIALSYTQSKEFVIRRQDPTDLISSDVLKKTIVLLGLIYLQLILGAVVRHTESGLAIPDFPTTAGHIIPVFNEATLSFINDWRFENNLEYVYLTQVLLHFSHRVMGFIILGYVIFLNISAHKEVLSRRAYQALTLINIAVVTQIILGILTVLTGKEVYTTTFHVTVGATFLGLTFLFILRCSPVHWKSFKRAVKF